MKIFITELQKLLSRRIFLIIALVALILNAYLMFRTAASSASSSSDYKAVYAELDTLNDSEKLDWLNARCEDFSGQHHFNFAVLYELREECDAIVNYQQYLDNINTQADSMSSISIFAKPDTFNYRSIMKTPSAYENMRDVNPVFDVSKGVILATDNDFTDILIAFIILFAVLTLILSDREQGLSGLLFSMKRGRGYLVLTKLIALAITTFIIILLIYGENLIIAEYIYGLGDLTRPVQSLNGFIGCNLKISVLGYLILYIAFKTAAFFTIGALLSLIAVNSKNSVTFYTISAIIIVIESLTYTQIHPLSIYSIFRYINFLAFTHINEIFCNFKNINFWEYPIPLIPTSIGAVIVISLICITFTAFIYSKKRNLEYKKLGIKPGFFKTEKLHKPVYYTIYKSLIMQCGAVIIAVFIAISGFMNINFLKEYDPTDKYYRYYCNELEGDITQETLDYIDAESIRFEEIKAKIEKLSEENTFSSELNQLSYDYSSSIGFYPLAERVSQVKDTENAQIFYDTGYKRAFGATGYDDDMKYALAAVLLCIFLVSPLISNDNRYRMNSVINSTKTGRRSYILRNILTAVIYGTLAALMWIIPYAIMIVQYYESNGLSASIRSIVDFKNSPLNVTVLQYIIIISTLRIIFTIFTSLVMLWISARCNNSTSAILINFAIFALPIIIYLLGAEFMVNIGFNPLLSVNVMFNEPSLVQLIIPLTFVGFMGLLKLKPSIFKK